VDFFGGILGAISTNLQLCAKTYSGTNSCGLRLFQMPLSGLFSAHLFFAITLFCKQKRLGTEKEDLIVFASV
jgi:hypothetical protein